VKKLLIVVVLLGVVLVGGAYWLHRPRTVTVSEGIFTYTPVEYGALRETVGATGILKPRDVLLVTSELPGIVVEVQARVNDLVSEGQIVLQLDDSTLRLKVEEAANAVEAAKAGVKSAKGQEKAMELALKYQQDLDNTQAFRSEKDQAEAKYRAAQMMVKAAEVKVKQAETARKEAQHALGKTKVRVPILPGSGTPRSKPRYIVLDSKLERGQMVGPTLPHPLFTLAADLSAMEVHAQVAEVDIGNVRNGMKATFTVSAYPEDEVKFSGQVSQVRPLPSSQQGPVYYDTVIDVTNQKDPATGQWRLRPGMTAHVNLIRREHKATWKVPVSALSFQMDDAYKSDAARAHLAEWNQRSDQADWRPVWIWDSQRGEPWPVFVRINTDGKPGLSDGTFNEVLAWEAGREPSPSDPPLRVILSAPPPHRPGLFEQPTNIKF
jgi:HlyD family secretion protein